MVGDWRLGIGDWDDKGADSSGDLGMTGADSSGDLGMTGGGGAEIAPFFV